MELYVHWANSKEKFVKVLYKWITCKTNDYQLNDRSWSIGYVTV